MGSGVVLFAFVLATVILSDVHVTVLFSQSRFVIVWFLLLSNESTRGEIPHTSSSNFKAIKRYRGFCVDFVPWPKRNYEMWKFQGCQYFEEGCNFDSTVYDSFCNCKIAAIKRVVIHTKREIMVVVVDRHSREWGNSTKL